MPLKVTVIRELPFPLPVHVRFSARVDPHVRHESRVLGELDAAHATVVGLFSGVGPFVHTEIVLAGEPLAALQTRVPPPHCDSPLRLGLRADPPASGDCPAGGTRGGGLVLPDLRGEREGPLEQNNRF